MVHTQTPPALFYAENNFKIFVLVGYFKIVFLWFQQKTQQGHLNLVLLHFT